MPGATIVTGQQPYLDLQLLWAGCLHRSQAACHTVGAAPSGQLPRDLFDAKSDYLSRPLPAAALSVLTAAIERRSQQPGHGSVLFDAYGGAINRVAPGATAFVHREMLCALQYLSYEADAGWLGQAVDGDAAVRLGAGVPELHRRARACPGLAESAYYGSTLGRRSTGGSTAPPACEPAAGALHSSPSRLTAAVKAVRGAASGRRRE